MAVHLAPWKEVPSSCIEAFLLWKCGKAGRIWQGILCLHSTAPKLIPLGLLPHPSPRVALAAFRLEQAKVCPVLTHSDFWGILTVRIQ